MRATSLRGFAWGLMVCLAGGMLAAGSPAQSHDERAVRAAYVYNLIKYVEWPSPDADLTIGFAGDAATGAVLEKLLGGKTSDGQTIRVVAMATDAEPHCRLLYVADAPDAEVRKTLERVKGRSVLTVGETDGFARAGGMVALVNTGDHIQIEVNLEAAQAAGIRISSRVLNLATIVRSSESGGKQG